MSEPRINTELHARRCHLAKRGPEDLPFIRKLWATPDFVRHFNPSAPNLPPSDADLSRILELEHDSPLEKARAIHWIIKDQQNRPWGLVSLTDLAFSHRRGELLVGTLPDAPFGLSVLAVLLAFEFFFREIRFNKLCSIVDVANDKSAKSTEHLGFQLEGRLRQHIYDWRGKNFVDVSQYAIFSDRAFSKENAILFNRLNREPNA